jgi:hypothetical protein
MFAATNETGAAVAFPDVCLTPQPPPVNQASIPYQNMAMLQNANADTCAQKVFITGAKAVTMQTEISQTIGDELGTDNGSVSGCIQGPAKFTSGSEKVIIEGAKAVFQGCTTKQNGDNANTVGTLANPSQTLVTIME